MTAVARFSIAAIAVFSLALAQAQTPQDRGLEIANEADHRDTGWEDSQTMVTMTLRDDAGREAVRRLEIETLESTEEGDKSLTRFETPRDIRGTALLTYTYKTQPDDQWLYLPALKRVKRIAAQNQAGPFMGSEFAFEDMSSQEVEKFTYLSRDEEPCPTLAGACYVVQRTPTSEYSGYSHQIVWIDQQHYRTDRVEYYDRKQSLLKTLQNKDFKQYLDRYWRPSQSLMTNHQTGKSTSLISEDIQFRNGLSANSFTPARLGR